MSAGNNHTLIRISAIVPSMKTTKHPSYFRLHHLSPLKHNLNIIKVNLHNPWATFVTEGEFLSTAHGRSNFCSGRFHTSKSRRFVRITCAKIQKRKATAPKVCYSKKMSEIYSTCVQEMMRKSAVPVSRISCRTLNDADWRGGSFDSWFSFSILYTSESTAIDGFCWTGLVRSGLKPSKKIGKLCNCQCNQERFI